MANGIKVYKSKVGIPNIGINVSGANTAANSLNRISESFAQTSNTFFRAAGEEAKKKGTEFGLSVPIEQVIGINPKTGMPEAYSLPDGYGDIAMDAFRAVVDQRFFESIEADYKSKAQELYNKNKLNVAKFESDFLNYTSKVVDNAQGKFKEFAREMGINQAKAYSAHIKNNIYNNSITKANELNKKQDNEFLEMMYNSGLRQLDEDYENPDTKFRTRSNDMPPKFVEDFVDGYLSSKTNLIKSKIVTQEEVLNTARQGVFFYLSGKLGNILDHPELANSVVNSDIFALSIASGEDVEKLPLEAREFVSMLTQISPDQKMIKDLLTIYRADKGLRESIRKDKADRRAEDLEKENAKIKKQNELKRFDTYDNINYQIQTNKDTFARKIIEGKISVADIFERIEELQQKNIDNQRNYITSDGALGYTDSKGSKTLTELNKLKGSVVNNIFSKVISDLSKTIPTNADSQYLIDVKNHITKILSGGVSADEVNEDLLGKKSSNMLRELLTKVPSPDNVIKNFNISQEFQTFDTNMKRRLELEKEVEQKKIKEQEVKQRIARHEAENSLLTRYSEIKNNIIQGIKEGRGISSDVNVLIAELRDAREIQSIYNDKSILTIDKSISLENELKSDVAKHLISNELISFAVVDQYGKNVNVKLSHLEALQDFIESGNSKIPVPQNLMDAYNTIQKIYNVDATNFKSFFKDIIGNFKSDLEEQRKKLLNIKDYVDYHTGIQKGVNGKTIDDIFKKVLLDGGNDSDLDNYFLSLEFAEDPRTYSMLANDNVSEGLFNLVKQLAEEPNNPKFEKDLSYIFGFLANLKSFPTGDNGVNMNIIPTRFKNDADIMRLLAVADFTMQDENVDFSQIVSNLTLAKNNMKNIDEFVKVFRKELKNESYEDHIQSVLGVKGINRLSDPDFFRMLDNEIPVASALGIFQDIAGLNNFLEKRYKDNWLFSNEVLENFNTPSGQNMTRYALPKIIPDKNLREATKDSIILETVLPFLNNQFEYTNNPIFEDGFAVKFGNKLYASKSDYNKENVIEIFLSPNRSYNAIPQTMVSELADGFEYEDPALSIRTAENFGIFFKTPDANTPMPLGGISQTNELDLLTKHHYTTIANGQAQTNYSETVTVAATTIGINSGGVELHFLLPTFWDGRVMPTQTEDDVIALLKRIDRTETKHHEYPSFLSPAEAEMWYFSQKEKWANIGTNAEQAQTILDNHSYLTQDILNVNPLEIARNFNKLDAIKINNKNLRKIHQKNKKIISEYEYGNMMPKFRPRLELSLEETEKRLEEIQIERIDKRNLEKFNRLIEYKNTFGQIGEDVDELRNNINNLHSIGDDDILPGYNSFGKPPDTNELPEELYLEIEKLLGK